MFSSTRTQTNTRSSTKNNILYNIITSNIQELDESLNSSNINTPIDNKNNKTALHYAVTLHDITITKLLLNKGADPEIKDGMDKNALELSNETNITILYEHLKKKNILFEDKCDEYKYEINNVKSQLKEKNNTIERDKQTISNLTIKYNNLEKNYNDVSAEYSNIKRKNCELENEYNVLKRKYNELENDNKKLMAINYNLLTVNTENKNRIEELQQNLTDMNNAFNTLRCASKKTN